MKLTRLATAVLGITLFATACGDGITTADPPQGDAPTSQVTQTTPTSTAPADRQTEDDSALPVDPSDTPEAQQPAAPDPATPAQPEPTPTPPAKPAPPAKATPPAKADPPAKAEPTPPAQPQPAPPAQPQPQPQPDPEPTPQPQPEPEPAPQRIGAWQFDPSTGFWAHDSGVLHIDPTGYGVLYETIYGYVADFNTGLVFDPFVQQWVNPYTYYGSSSSGGSGWSYSSIFGYGASDGTNTGFNLGNGCIVINGSASC